MFILKKIYLSFIGIPSIFIDGCLYILLALLTGMSLTFGSDDAEKFITPVILFYLKAIISWLSAGFLALKLFRSTAFADHKEAVAAKESGTVVETSSETKITTESKLPNEKENISG